MTSRVSAFARVTITIEVESRSSWGSGCSIDQIERQAGQESLHALQDAMITSKLRARVIGKPIVSAVITKPE